MTLVLAGLGEPAADVFAQSVDCGQLSAQIAGADDGGGGRYAAAAQRQRAEIDRTSAYARSLGCDRQQFLFFGSAPPPQCGGINARIAQMQGNLAQLQSAGGGGRRQQLVATYNAYCRGGGAVAQRPRGFFEQLFGGSPDPAPPPQVPDGSDAGPQVADDGDAPRGGSQAVCVRTCDGGFFPMNYSARRDSDSLNEMCHALCPNVETSVYTRAPSREIQSAVSLSGAPYVDLPNALKYQKTFDPACTCRPAGQSWAQTLANADSLLGTERRGDILVTPEKSAEMARPKADVRAAATKARKASEVKPIPPSADDASAADATAAAQVPTASAASAGITPGSAKSVPYSPGVAELVTGPDGLKRSVRKVGPQL